ncbi:MAG: methyl-accepting chemotaxis protein [Proteobacteria bacterium]|nr:methyl-accepting chemotaxis protein [Pseudomonadota bacterium]
MKLLSILNINRIATKIWIMLLVSIGGIAFFVVAFYFLGQRSNDALKQIHEKGFIILDNVRAMQLISRSFTPDRYENIDDPISAGMILSESLAEIESLWLEIQKAEGADEQEVAFEEVFNTFKQHSRDYQKANLDPAITNVSDFNQRWSVSRQRLIDFLDQLAANKREATFQLYQTEKQFQEQATRLIIILSSIGGLLFAVLSIWNISLITKPLAKVINMIHDLGDGKFYARTKIAGQDEISQVAQTLDELAELLSGMFSNFIQNSKVLGNSSEEVSTSTIQIEKATDNIAQNANQEVQLLNMSRNLILGITETLNTTTEEINDLQKIASSAQKETEAVTDSITKVDESMSKIQDSGIQIEDIVGVITDISNRTNLLSLNAAIEAAKAGDYGKGFAVVADEVGKLAEKSATSVIEIQELIETSTSNIQVGTEVIQDTRKVLQRIIKLVQQISNMTNEAAEKLTEQNRTMTEIAHSAEGVVSISERNSSSAQELSGTVKQIARTMESLQEMADKINDQLSSFTV